MDDLNKNSLVITKLIQETQRGTIIWESSTDKTGITLPFDGEVIDKIYISTLNDVRFRIFRFRFKEFDSDLVNFYFESSIRLEIIDNDGFSEWEFPSDNSLNDLYEAVRYKVADVNKLIDNILGIFIIKAEYKTNKKSVDISRQLTEKILNNELHIIVTNEIAGDPDPGMVKSLKIKYYYQGKLYEQEIKEGQRLDIPLF